MRVFIGVAGIAVSLVCSAGIAHAAGSWAESDGISADPSTTTYSEVKEFLQGVASRYPKSAKVFELGESDSGEIIQGLAIGSGPINNLVVASHHGNEYGSVEVTRAFALSIAAQPIPGQTVYVIPVLNIAGYDSKERREYAQGRSWDPNRNYPGPCGTEGPFTLKSTRALAEFIDNKGIVSSATMHTFYPAVVYPWGMSTPDLATPYDDLFRSLVQAATVASHYPVGNSTEVIYPADGAFEDYAFWKHGIWSLLFEVGETHWPSLAQVRQMAQVNVPGLRQFLEQAPRERAKDHGFSGRCDASLRALDLHQE